MWALELAFFFLRFDTSLWIVDYRLDIVARLSLIDRPMGDLAKQNFPF